MADFANAKPTKRFFLQMLTRDISFEDAILDMVDNCIDALARTRSLPLDERLLDQDAVRRASEKVKEDGIPRVSITIKSRSVFIEDNCGGIPLDKAKEEIFALGRDEAATGASRLSVYGIGLKRAVFKLGKRIAVESHTEKDGFEVLIDTVDWAAKDEWQFPLKALKQASSRKTAGTTITVTELNDEIQMRISDPHFLSRLEEAIRRPPGFE